MKKINNKRGILLPLHLPLQHRGRILLLPLQHRRRTLLLLLLRLLFRK
jgi:hypothetical protein